MGLLARCPTVLLTSKLYARIHDVTLYSFRAVRRGQLQLPVVIKSGRTRPIGCLVPKIGLATG